MQETIYESPKKWYDDSWFVTVKTQNSYPVFWNEKRIFKKNDWRRKMKNYYQPEIETMPLEQLQSLQSERLAKQVKFVYDNVQF